MTKTNQVLKLFLSFTILMSTAAFKRGDVIQTETILRGRTSANFVTKSNIRYRRLPVGTVGRVLKVVSFHHSGNEGVQILLEGPKYDKLPESQRKVWVYNWTKRSNDLKQCKDESCSEEVPEMLDAPITKTLKAQPATETKDDIQALVEQRSDNSGWKWDGDDETSATGTGCVDCNSKKASVPVEPIDETSSWVPQEIPEIASNIQLTGNDLTFSGGRTWGARCANIISNDGEIGSYGQTFLSYMAAGKYGEGQNNAFLSDNALKAVCPGFARMTDSQKYKAWLVFWAALAEKESGCKPATYHPLFDKHGKRVNYTEGWGMYAAELHSSKRDWRGSECQGDIKKASKQIECAVSTMYDMSLTPNGSATARSADHPSYWGPVRRGMIKAAMNRIQECG